jgi:hypothetical protein
MKISPPGEVYVLRSQNSTRPLPKAQQRWPDLAATEKGIDAPSLILIAVISCLCSLASVWAAFSGVDLSANWL